MGINDHVLRLAIFGVPLNGASGGFHLHVFILEEHFEVTHVPGGGVGFPGAVKAAGGGVAAFAGAVLVDPAKTHFLNGRAFGLGANQGRVACAVHLAKSVAAGHQGHSFVVVHGHAGEGFAHVVGRQLGVGVAVWTLRVDVNQAHLNGGQGVVQLALAAVTAVVFVAGGQPLFFSAPENVFLGCPNVRATAAKAKGLEAHGFHGHVATQDEQVGPRNFVAVFLFNRPQQAATFVEVAVVGKAVEGGKALVAGAGATTAVGGTVGTGSMPGQANEQTTVVAPVGRPPLLVVGHQVNHVFFECGKVKLGEFFAVVIVRIHGVGDGLVLVQDGQVQLVRPPICVGAPAVGGVRANNGMKRTLGRGWGAHVYSCE